MKVKLVTFADGSFGLRAAGKRLVAQSDATGWFDHPSEHWTLETLRSKMPDFMAEHQSFINKHPRGLGLWIWKPAILSYLVEQLGQGEIVVLLDAGCQLNSTKNSSIRFREYLQLCSEKEMLLMQLAEGSFGFDDLTESAWTKHSVLDALDPRSNFRLTNQIQSGIIFVSKSEKTQRITSKWLDYSIKSNYSYLLDPLPAEPQSAKFRQHRWEQSLISLIAKTEGIVPIKDETYYYPNWDSGLNFPIWAMRNRSGGDAYRRNLKDMLFLSAAKIERRFRSLHKIKHW